MSPAARAALFGIALGVHSAAPAAAQAATDCFGFWENFGAPHLDLERLGAVPGAALGSDTAANQPAGWRPVHRPGHAMLTRCGWSPDQPALAAIPGSPRVAILPAALVAELNTGYPRLQRDGARWAGRGTSTALMAGAGANWGPVSAVLAPVLVTAQNRDFDIVPVPTPGLSRYGSHTHPGTIDLPQRFGANEQEYIEPGASFIRVDGFGFAAGISTETLRWGPARRYPPVLSGTAPGFLHGFLGTGRPVSVGIGTLEAEATWGRLTKSAWFDTLPDDGRLFAGLVLAFTPAGSGLTVGGSRVYSRYLPEDGLSLDELLLGPYGGVRINPGLGAPDADNQMLSAFFRWVFPESRAEVYGEYARDDHWEDADDLLMELDHSRAFVVGLQKVFSGPAGEPRLRVAGEVANLHSSTTWLSGRGQAIFYTHSQIVEGHTHRGQLLGAPIGPGADAQYVAADWFLPRGLVGLGLERVRYDNEVYYQRHAYQFSYRGHDVELAATLRGLWLLSGFQVAGEVGWGVRHNRGFVSLENESRPGKEDNLRVFLGLAWAPGGGRSGR